MDIWCGRQIPDLGHYCLESPPNVIVVVQRTGASVVLKHGDQVFETRCVDPRGHQRQHQPL
jgi:hypothetical protein